MKSVRISAPFRTQKGAVLFGKIIPQARAIVKRKSPRKLEGLISSDLFDRDTVVTAHAFDCCADPAQLGNDILIAAFDILHI